ncbi:MULTISPECIES: YkvI family membrane protein [Clostridium]|uniref:YkvI family membrane protein n=1 Tax=Clostridium TaxID=1485 RepID=UPI00069E46E3|nr:MULTISPECIES: branched-chain amino acid transport system II carrier protein [Clostridium]KOF56175.1 transporter [Clostridium sp. DMHC 10]MCD2348231.1 branched-chain amino acid transport system II carrier protein [Clostridium guangxiense]
MNSLKSNLKVIFQIAAVFIGTIVGAGLASGQEISQFFTIYGNKSFLGLVICTLLYIVLGNIIIKLSKNFKLNSYKELISLVSPGILGNIITIIVSFFMLSSAAIILAGSGSLLAEFFKIPKLFGTIIMITCTLFVLFRNTAGIIEINSIIVPILITVISLVFILYFLFSNNIEPIHASQFIVYKKNWLISSILYSAFNILCCSGVLVPLSTEKEYSSFIHLILGIALGSLALLLISSMINLMLILNLPYTLKYEIPLLYISSRFGKMIQFILLITIWCEMLSTEISDIYSIAKSIENSFLKFSYKKSIIIVIIIALPISQIGFKNLISVLYPAFGVVSVFFMIQCSYFYVKHK